MKQSDPKPAIQLVRPRVFIGENLRIGPGKIDLLRLIGEKHSISAAAKAMNLPYKKAWQLIDELNTGFGQPMVTTATGGKGGGGASVTPLGEALISHYEALEKRLNAEAVSELEAIIAIAQPANR